MGAPVTICILFIGTRSVFLGMTRENRSWCMPPRGSRSGHPRRETVSSGSNDGILPARARREIIYFPVDGFRGFCALVRAVLLHTSHIMLHMFTI